jgi:MFS family permease
MVYMTVFIDFIGIAILIPVQPFLVGIQPHKDAFTADAMGGLQPGAANSVIMVSFTAAQLISTLVFGPLSDRLGRRPLLLTSLMGGALGYLMQGVAIAMGNFFLLIAMRVFTGLFGGTRPVAVAYIADSVPPEKRAKLMGLMALSITLAMQFGPALGGSIGLISLAVPCFVAAGIATIGFGLAWFMLVESRRPGKLQLGGSHECRPAGDRIAFGLNTAFSFCAGFWGLGTIFIQALLLPAKFNFDTNKVGLAALGDGLMILCGTPVYMMLIKHIRVPLVAAVGCVMMSLQAACPFFPDLLPVFVFRYASGLGGPLAIPAVSAIVSLIAPPHRRGAWTGLTLAAQALGRTVAPVALGVIFDLDYRIPFCIIGGIALSGLFLTLCIAPRLPRVQKTQSGPGAARKEQAEDPGIVPDIQIPETTLEVDELSEVSHHAEALVLRLREKQAKVQSRLTVLEEGKPDLDAPFVSPEERESAATHLSEWFVKLLERNGYNNWPAHMDGIKLMIFNSFPPVRTGSQVEKLTDIITVYEGHIAMAEQSRLLDGIEDVVQAI